MLNPYVLTYGLSTPTYNEVRQLFS